MSGGYCPVAWDRHDYTPHWKTKDGHWRCYDCGAPEPQEATA